MSVAKTSADNVANAGFDYDLCVIGGGSGGMAAAKEAASHGARVILFDYVKPSPRGTKWGLGGTCVNVGCVPKKLMHAAALAGSSLHDASKLGWVAAADAHAKHDWVTLRNTVRNHVRSSTLATGAVFGLQGAVQECARGATGRAYSVVWKTRRRAGNVDCRAHSSCNGRPSIRAQQRSWRARVRNHERRHLYLDKAPGKTLRRTAAMATISLESAGFLNELGFDVSVAVRSVVLRGFDRDCAAKVCEVMEAQGVKFLQGSTPVSITRKEGDEDGRLEVELKGADGNTVRELFDTVLFATGRAADTSGLSLDKVGVALDEKGKVIPGPAGDETTNIPHIHAVGDILQGKPELTPVAIKAGELLARRLFAGASQAMDYSMIPTTVFTPSEYGCVGLSEEEAAAKYGAEAIESYLWQWTSLEHAAVHRLKHERIRENEVDYMPPNCMAKLVCLKVQEERVVGFHFVGPNAGEVTQGFALAVKLGAKKTDFDNLLGIHPTDAEALCSMESRRSEISDAADWTASVMR